MFKTSSPKARHRRLARLEARLEALVNDLTAHAAIIQKECKHALVMETPAIVFESISQVLYPRRICPRCGLEEEGTRHSNMLNGWSARDGTTKLGNTSYRVVEAIQNREGFYAYRLKHE